MVIGGETGKRYGLTMKNTPTYNLAQFTYLGTITGPLTGKAIFNQMPKLFKSHNFNIIKIRLIVFKIWLYRRR